jgi:hypothetical protein
MRDGRWEMGDGRWEMGDGRWEMGDGRWEMGDEVWTRGKESAGKLAGIIGGIAPSLRKKARAPVEKEKGAEKRKQSRGYRAVAGTSTVVKE